MARTATAKRERAQAQAAAQAAALAARDLKIAALESIIDYSFADSNIAWEALQLPGNGFSIDGNRRLAVIGDLIIDMILAQQWYSSGADRAKWAHTRETVSANKNLGK
ncbi:MAG: hypothetical protein M1823_008637, partial [Watsoniomyces obsoletus]